jgi:hypothetical protein
MYLLPGDRLFTADDYDNASLYNWRTDCPSSTLPPSQQELDPVDPYWHRRLDRTLYFDGIVTPTILHGSVQVIIPSDEEVISVKIPLDPSASEDYTHILSIIKKPEYEIARQLRAFGHRQGVGLSADHVLTLIRYCSEDGVGGELLPTRVQSFECPDLTEMKNPPDCLLYDEFSQRVMLMDAKLSYTLTVDT